jgi:hypothetical protein
MAMSSEYRSSRKQLPGSGEKQARAYARFNGDVIRTPQTWKVHFKVDRFPPPISWSTKPDWLSIERLSDWSARISITVTVASKDHDPLSEAEERLFNFLSTYNVVSAMNARIESCEGAKEKVVEGAKEELVTRPANGRLGLGAISNVQVVRMLPRLSEVARLENVQQTAKVFELNESLVKEENSFLHLAIGYYNHGKSATESDERVLDWVVALEALFSDSEGELVHKLASRIAWFLGRDGEDRIGIAKRVRDLYGIRSNIVHGRKHQITGEDILTLESYVRKSIIKILERADNPTKDKILSELQDEMFGL